MPSKRFLHYVKSLKDIKTGFEIEKKKPFWKFINREKNMEYLYGRKYQLEYDALMSLPYNDYLHLIYGKDNE